MKGEIGGGGGEQAQIGAQSGAGSAGAGESASEASAGEAQKAPANGSES